MSTFLVGISWCDPEEVAAYKRVGLDDDPRCSTGLFIDAANPDEALSWAKTLAAKFMEFLFHEKQYPPEALEISCRLEPSPESSGWKHCLDFFQRISVGQFPDFRKMTVEAYTEWCKKEGIV
jgi:hypothetical protein